jgi:kojibiose phosphorylase
MAEGLERYLSSSEWHIAELGWDPARQNARESIFTLGNGLLGSRGVLEEIPTGARPGTFFAGLYDTTGAQVTELVNAPNPIFFQVAIGGEKLDVSAMDVLDHKRILDLRQAALFRESLFRTTLNKNRVRFQSLRFFSMHNPHVAVMQVAITPLDESTCFTIRSSVDTGVTNMGLVTEGAKRHFHIHDFHDEGAVNYLCTKTLEQEVLLAYAHQAKVKIGRRERSTPRRKFEIKVRKGSTVFITKYFAFYTSQHRPPGTVHAQAVKTLKRAVLAGFDVLLERHRKKWQKLWRQSDVRIKGDAEMERALRFNIYHMLIAGSEHNSEHVSVGARTLSGEGYRGHVFWDTEIFILPFFIYTSPAIARKLLLYRYHHLPAARDNAKANGYKGAMFPWESAACGGDVTPTWHKNLDGKVIEIHTMQQEHHITADIAFAVCHYYETTDDIEFMGDSGLELLLEAARFWASRVEYDKRRKKYVIHNIIGPDEFHENVNNNAFTNAMAGWTLNAAGKYYVEVRKRRPDKTRNLARRLGLRRSELDKWKKIEENILIPRAENGKLVEQFEGFFKRKKLPLPDLDSNLLPHLPSRVPLEKIGTTQFVKQADVVMLLYLLPEMFSPESMKRNFTHYERRTLHKSSLSAAVHAIVAGRLGLTDMAYRYLQIAAFTDLRDIYGNTADGMHAASLGGSWQGVLSGLAGMRPNNGALCLNPRMPGRWKSLVFTVAWQGTLLDVVIEKRVVSVHCHPPSRKVVDVKRKVALEVDGQRHELQCGERRRFPRAAVVEPIEEMRGLF